ncbi:hypothetical protein [Sphingobium sp. Z007]|nr:hypothetical protein [Sphingobium sp. Z007]
MTDEDESSHGRPLGSRAYSDARSAGQANSGGRWRLGAGAHFSGI